MALGGGIIKGTKTFQNVSNVKQVSTAKTVLCIVFLKDTRVPEDNFQAYSIVIKGSGLSKEEFDSHLYHVSALCVKNWKKYSWSFVAEKPHDIETS